MRRMSRFVVVLIAVLGCLMGLMRVQAQAPDGMTHHAAVIVQYGPGQVVSRCVGFNEETISGHDALIRGGFSVIAETSGGMGSLVCSIDGTGCNFPEEPCACQCQGSACSYWAYSHLLDGVWRYSVQGSSSYRVRDGAVEGWAWGGGSSGSGSTPPLIQWGDICAAQAAPIEPTVIPPTAIPPTQPPTALPPTALPPTATAGATATRPTSTATAPQATLQPISTPTEPPVATATQPQAATATTTATETPSNNERITLTPAREPQTPATGSPTMLPTQTAIPSPLAAGGSAPIAKNPASTAPQPASQSWLSYGIVGIVVLGLIGAAWLRRRTR